MPLTEPGQSRASRAVRPWSITILGWLFVLVGCGGALREAVSYVDVPGFFAEGSWVVGLSALSILGGVFALRGQNWARWLLLAWMGAHVLISFWHARIELLVHCLAFLAVTYALFRAPAQAYFRGARTS